MKSPLLIYIFILPVFFSLILILAPRWGHWINEWYDSTQIKGKNLNNIHLPEQASRTRIQILQITGWLLLALCVFLFFMLYFSK